MLRSSHLNISGAFQNSIFCRCRMLFLVVIIDGDE